MPRRPKEDRASQLEELAPVEDPIPPIERTGPEPFDRFGRPLGRRLGVSVPGAIGGALLVCALAFGANLPTGGGLDLDEASNRSRDTGDPNVSFSALAWTGGDSDPGGDADVPGGDPDVPGGDSDPGGESDVPGGDSDPGGDADATKAPQPTDSDEPEETAKPEKTAKPEPKPEKTEKPKPAKTEKPEPKPEKTQKPVLGLKLAIMEGAVLADWSSCKVDGGEYYKVVRSTDSTAKWPTGGNDELIAAVEMGGATKAWDEHAPAGKKVWYRVFCVRHTDDGYKVLSASAAKAIRTPAKPKPTPKPEPADMWIEADISDGAVTLHWEACGSDGFSHYRILRKAGGESQVIAEIEDHEVTTYVDDGLEPGEHKYLVQSKGKVDGEWILLGSTGWVGVAVE